MAMDPKKAVYVPAGKGKTAATSRLPKLWRSKKSDWEPIGENELAGPDALADGLAKSGWFNRDRSKD